METLILGFFLGLIATQITALFGLIATLIATWYSARLSKVTDTRTQLLNRIDDSVDDCTKFFFYENFQLDDLNFDLNKLLEAIPSPIRR